MKLTKRKYLCGGSHPCGKKLVDMEAVYRDLNSGMKLATVCIKYGVSATTLRRRHYEYQQEVEALEKEHELRFNDELPPLPDD